MDLCYISVPLFLYNTGMSSAWNIYRWLGFVWLAAGCSFINFSGHYYTLPADYSTELALIWNRIETQLPIKNEYQIHVIRGRDSDRLDGVPAVSGRTVYLPEDFVKYVYQNYYNDRFHIFGSVIVHELAHIEYDLPSSPPEKHFETDQAAIRLLGGDLPTAEYYYKSLYVMKDYWFARKGVAGHALNAAWNLVNAASLVYGGPAYFADLYATDLDQRMKLIAKQYKLKSCGPFRRSRG